MTGYSDQEAMGKNPRILKTGYTTDEQYLELWRIISSGGTWEGMFCNKKKDGDFYWESAKISPILNESGIITHYMAVKEDITKRKQIEEQIEMLKKSIDVMPEGAYWMDVDFNFVYINEAGLKSLGYAKEELIGKSLMIVNPSVTPEGIIKLKELLIKGGLSKNETIHRRKDGSELHVEVSTTYVKYDNKEYFCGIAMDITKRKETELMLEKERRLLRTVIDNIPDSVYCLDVECRKTLANVTDLRYMGAKSEAEVLGKNDFDFYPEEIAKEFFELDHKVIQSNLPLFNIEESLLDEYGAKVWLLSSKIPIQDKNGNVIGLLGIGRDITARKKAELEIIHKNEELRKVNAEKDKFFSILAHDLRSPFNGFLGLTEVMAKELNHMTLNEIQEIAFSLNNSAANLYTLLGNLLEWSRIQRGLISVNPASILLSSIINNCLNLTIESAKNKQIQLGFDIPDNLMVFTDSNILEGIIRNLTNNAVKFTPIGGKIDIVAKSTSDNFVEISIRDTGIGMSKQMIDDLFKLDINTSRKGTEGETSTGLGLIICMDLIEKLGGDMRIESEEGKGSTFSFTIPQK